MWPCFTGPIHKICGNAPWLHYVFWGCFFCTHFHVVAQPSKTATTWTSARWTNLLICTRHKLEMRNFIKLHPSFRKTIERWWSVDISSLSHKRGRHSRSLIWMFLSRDESRIYSVALWVCVIDTKINCTTFLVCLPSATALKPPASYHMVSPHSAKTAPTQWSTDMAHFGGVLWSGMIAVGPWTPQMLN